MQPTWLVQFDDPVIYDADMDVEMTDAPPLENEQPSSRCPPWQEIIAHTTNLRAILNNTAYGAKDVVSLSNHKGPHETKC